jgi:hypothetical protein
MHDNGGQLPDVRGEDIATLARNHAGMTALDRIISLNSPSNTFNNFISPDTDTSIR